ncbi:MAG: arsenite S-adenosylmethyltransferase, partial [Bacillota bacterium]
MDHILKDKVKTYYGGIAKKVNQSTKASCGCGAGCCGDNEADSKLYTKEFLEQLPEEAVNASLGCA